MANICRKCLLREMAEAEQQKIERYKEAIRKDDRVTEQVYETRLSLCKKCGKLWEGTCNACGCYVELRALVPQSHCPYKKW